MLVAASLQLILLLRISEILSYLVFMRAKAMSYFQRFLDALSASVFIE